VREWVLDLPQGTDPDADALLREWIADQQLHSLRAHQLALGIATPIELPADLRARLRTFAVARGLPLGSRAGLLGEDGMPLPAIPDGSLPPSVPGVVRGEQLRRDGRDIAAGIDPRMASVGFRVVGGSDFVARVRGR
jgi:hypothetical protein